MNRKTIADKVYRAMRDAYTHPGRYLTRAPGVGMDVINYLARRDWITLDRQPELNKHGQKVWTTRGGHLTGSAISSLRLEAQRRGDDLPDPAAVRLPAQRSITAQVDPFALVASGGPREIPLPF